MEETMNEKVHTTEALNRLARVCKDSEMGLRRAAAEVQDQNYRSMLHAAALHRSKWLEQIRSEIQASGGKAATVGTISGMVHRNWMNLRYTMNLHSQDVVLRECLRGEEFALKEFESIIEEHEVTMDAILENFFVNIIETRNALREILNPALPEEKGSSTSMLHL